MSSTSDYDANTQYCGFRWCVRDACGLVCVIITWLLILYGYFCTVTILFIPDINGRIQQIVNGVIFHILTLLTLASHLRTMFTDPHRIKSFDVLCKICPKQQRNYRFLIGFLPQQKCLTCPFFDHSNLPLLAQGAVPKGNATNEYIERLSLRQGQVVYKCAKCCSIKPERAHHCSICQRCIRRMDHHCPWVNNCVGEANQKCFVLFTFYVALLSSHALYWGVCHFMSCVGQDWKDCSLFAPPMTTFLLIILLFESILFSIFTWIMFGTQLSAICSDETGIESLKDDLPTWSRHDRWKNLQMIFGGRFSIDWFNPFKMPYISKQSFEFSV